MLIGHKITFMVVMTVVGAVVGGATGYGFAMIIMGGCIGYLIGDVLECFTETQ